MPLFGRPHQWDKRGRWRIGDVASCSYCEIKLTRVAWHWWTWVDRHGNEHAADLMPECRKG